MVRSALPLFDKNLDSPSGSSDQRAIVVGSVPRRGIRKSTGTTAASADGLFSGDVLELLKSRISLAAAVTETIEAEGDRNRLRDW